MCGHRDHLHLQTGVKTAFHPQIDQLLNSPHSHGALGQQLVHQLVGRFLQLISGNCLIDEPQLLRFSRCNTVAGIEKLLRLPDANKAR